MAALDFTKYQCASLLLPPTDGLSRLASGIKPTGLKVLATITEIDLSTLEQCGHQPWIDISFFPGTAVSI